MGLTGPWMIGEMGRKQAQVLGRATHVEPRMKAELLYCMQCKMPSPDMKRAIEEEKAQRAMDEGRGGGLFDRQDPNDRNDWDSGDEEVDEFGRRKGKRAPLPKMPRRPRSGRRPAPTSTRQRWKG